MFLVQAVEVHHAQQLLAVDRLRSFVQVLHVRSHRVVAVRDVEFELVLVDAGRAEGVDVFHHQVPCAATFFVGCVRAVFQHLQCQRIRRVQLLAAVRRELTDLIDTAVVRVFVSHRQDFVLVQRALQRYITQCAVERIFAAGQQPRTLDLLEVISALHAVHPFQHLARLLQITEIGRADSGIKSVGVVVRCQTGCATPRGVVDMVAVLAEVRKSHDVTRLVVVTAFIRDPNLYLVDCHARSDIGHTRHRRFVAVAEIVAQEEMSVLVVAVAADVELGHLRSAFAAHGLRLAVLLADERLNAELAELQVRLDSEKCLTASDERRGQIHRHITGFDRLDDVVLFAFVVQFEVLLVERERSLGVVTHVKIEFRTDFSLYAGLDLLVEIEDVVIARAYSKRRVGDVLVLESEEQLGASLHLQLHTARTEHFVRRTDIELHVGDVELGLVVMLHLAYFLLPVPVHDLPLGVMVIFVLRQHIRRRDVGLADACVQHVHTCLRLVFHGGGYITRILQIQ